MKRRLFLIPLVFFFFSAVFLNKIQAGSVKKYTIAVPNFVYSDEIPETTAVSLTEALKVEFENSGRIVVLGNSDIEKAFEEIKELGESDSLTSAECIYNNACAGKLGRKMLADYVANLRVSKMADNYLVEASLLPVGETLNIPALAKTAESESALSDAAGKIGANLALRFPLEGNVQTIYQNGRNVIINLGSIHNLKAGDEFFVLRETVIEGFRDRRRVGSIMVTDIQESRSKTEVKSGRGDIQKGDIVVLNQEEILQRLEAERLADEAKITGLKKGSGAEQEEDDQTEGYAEDSDALSFAGCASFIRAGYGGPGMVGLGEEHLNKYYTSGTALLTDFFFYRLRGRKSGNGLDFHLRYYYRQYEMTGETFDEFREDYPAVKYGISELKIHSIDLGTRVIFGGYFLFSRVDLYCIGAFRQAFIIETADNDVENRYSAVGFMGGGGLEIALHRRIAVFGEYNIGYTTVGDNEDNIEGHQVLVGLSFRTEHL